MRKHKTTKLQLDAITIRHLDSTELRAPRGGMPTDTTYRSNVKSECITECGGPNC